MRLTDFIEQAHDKIVEEWVAFAATLLPWAEGLDEAELRDHAEELLAAVVRDIRTPQTRREQADKSKGLAPTALPGDGGSLAAVGQAHASERLESGFKLGELVSEYRALRASVLRLWTEAHGEQQSEVTRFNEAIDESLTVATTWYAQALSRTREQFLAILGHDLRNPLAAIAMSAQLLARSASSLDDAQLKAVTRIIGSAERMERMVNDLLDLTRTRLGGGIPVRPEPLDLARVCHHVIAELEAGYPGRRVIFESEGDLHGEWDGDRLHQAVSNLVANALHHGALDGCVSVVAEGHDELVVLRVHNEGPAIPPQVLSTLFDPMVRRPTAHEAESNRSGLGLGLFIVCEIATAHGGSIDATSSDPDGTTFTVRLPRTSASRS